MMMSEFTERTGFDPTGEEYRAIEEEYMGCSEDKDTFCKEWKKSGGVQRLMRMRARKIEQLESHVKVLERKNTDLMDERKVAKRRATEAEKRCDELEKENDTLKRGLKTLVEADAQWKKIVGDLETQIAEYKNLEEKFNAFKSLIAMLTE